jgi:hypothetical protein
VADDGTAPVMPPFHIKPTAAPTATKAAGDFYVDSTTGLLMTSDGTVYAGPMAKRPVKIVGATLTKADSGAHCVFAATTVTTYTLPAAEAGLNFRFSCEATAAGTADIFRIVCATGDFFIGSFVQSTDGTYTSATHKANGTTHLAWEGNGSTTGGLDGDWLEITASSDTLWRVYGMGRATGSEATPWKTS